MGTYCCNLLSNCYCPNYSITNDVAKLHHVKTRGNSLYGKPIYFDFHKHHFDSVLVAVGMDEIVKKDMKEENHGRFRWIEIRHNITEEQRQAISKLPFKMANRCKALMRQIICFSAEKGNISDLLEAWVKIMSPSRADWLAVLKELKNMDNPLYLEVFCILFHLKSISTEYVFLDYEMSAFRSEM